MIWSITQVNVHLNFFNSSNSLKCFIVLLGDLADEKEAKKSNRLALKEGTEPFHLFWFGQALQQPTVSLTLSSKKAKLHEQIRKMFTLHSGTWKWAKPRSTKTEKIIPNKMKGFTCQLTVYHRLIPPIFPPVGAKKNLLKVEKHLHI